MKLLSDVARQLLLLPKAPPERGGIIGGRDGIITVFCLDSKIGSLHEAAYEPNVSLLNDVISKWFQSGIEFYGIVHTHPEGECELSSGDIIYIEQIMADAEDGEKLYFPIILPGAIFPFAAKKNMRSVKIEKESLNII